jgi:adenylate cyclase
VSKDAGPPHPEDRAGLPAPAELPTPAELQRRLAHAAGTVRAANRRQGIVQAVRTAREMLPGDENFGDELSIAGDQPSAVIARFLAERQTEDAGKHAGVTVTSEAGLAALQVWQALSERVGRGAGVVEATILFTDLVAFSSWVLEAGDEQALELLRAVASVVEPEIVSRRGRVVKRLGDGHMAVFADPCDGVQAALAMQEGLDSIEVGGHRPRLRAGLHRGAPRRIGGDYLGTDVNIAARVGQAAGAGEVLISAAVMAGIDEAARGDLQFKRRRFFRAKGAPRDLEVFLVRRA